MVEVTLSTSTVEASTAYDSDLHPHRGAGTPQGGQFAPKNTAKESKQSKPRAPAKKAPAKQQRDKQDQSGGDSAPAHSGKRHRRPPMSVGANNDPAKVKQLQALIRELGLGHGVIDGQYGPATERAVMAAQRKLGMKPTGKASNAFLKRLHDAHALSPCTPKSGSKVAAAAAGPVELDAEVDGEFVEVLASGCDLFDLARWSDDTVWLVDADDDGLLELDRGDVAVVAAGLQQLVGEVTAVDVAGWLSLDSDGAVATISADADGGPVAVTFPADAVRQVAESLWTLHGRMGRPVRAGHPHPGQKYTHGWVPVSELIDALKAAGGSDEAGLYTPDDGPYLDWSSKQSNGNRFFEAAPNQSESDEVVSLTLDHDEMRKLSRELSISGMQPHAAAGAPTHVAMMHHLGGTSGVHFDAGTYMDWSVVNPDGSRNFVISDGADAVDFDLTAEQFAALQASIALTVLQDGQIQAAAGHDVTPGHDQLHHWWTVGPGRKRWVDSPTPWTTLLAQLVEEVKGVPLETLKRWASRWFIEVKGYAAGSDANRVAHGHKPRGEKVGPG